ncbi:MAG: type II CAAX endopeptidase family protein [Cutibacterium avidum]|nr:type II CAAX endopeptidase family protein [Cutibacterium avidum]
MTSVDTQKTSAAVRPSRRSVPARIGLGALVLVGIPVAYLLIAAGALLVAGGTIAATLIADAAVAVIGAVLLATGTVHLPAPRMTGSGARVGWGAVGLAALVVVAGQTASVRTRLTWGSPGFAAHEAATTDAPVWMGLALSLAAAPLAEEMLLRGLMYPLLRRISNVPVAVVATTAVFMGLHGNLVQAVAVVPLGILAALLVEVTGRLWPAVAAHLGFNLAAGLLPPGLVTDLATWPVVVLLAGLVAAGLVVWFRSASGRREQGHPDTDVSGLG